MSKNKVQNLFVGPIKDMKNKQNEHHTNYYRGRHRLVPFTERVLLTGASVSSSSDVGWTDVDVSSEVSEDAIAVILAVFFSDTGSATTNCFVKYRQNGSSSDGTGFVYGRHLNAQWESDQMIIPLDSNKIFEYSVDASGPNTATLATYIVGYFEQLS